MTQSQLDKFNNMSSPVLLKSMHIDHRRDPRKILRVSGQLHSSNNVVELVKTIDISVSGLGFIAQRQLPERQTCKISFKHCNHEGVRSFTVEGNVVYSILRGMEGFCTGLQFSKKDEAVIRLIEGLA